jgi:hypothetical protein
MGVKIMAQRFVSNMSPSDFNVYEDWRSTRPNMHVVAEGDPPPGHVDFIRDIVCEHDGLTFDASRRRQLCSAVGPGSVTRIGHMLKRFRLQAYSNLYFRNGLRSQTWKFVPFVKKQQRTLTYIRER